MRLGEVLKNPIVKFSIPAPQIQNASLEGVIIAFDPSYGNIWTNISKAWVERFDLKFNATYQVQIFRGKTAIYNANLPLKRTFGEVGKEESLLYPNSNGDIALAINQGNFVKRFQVDKNDRVIIKKLNK